MASTEGTVVGVPVEPVEHDIPLADCPARQVTVFTDRAEVTRLVQFTPPAEESSTDGGDGGGGGGEKNVTPPLYVVVVKGLTAHADSDSIRVKPVNTDAETTGLIREVSYSVHHTPPTANADDQPRAKAAREAKQAAIAERNELRAQVQRAQERDALVQGYMKSMLVTPATTRPGDAGTAVVGPPAGAGLETVEKLLKFHETHSASVDGAVAALQDKIKKAEQKRDAADAELREIRAQYTGTRSSRDVTIVLDGATAATLASASGGMLSLTMTYVVRGASWSPIYDVRVDDLHADPVPTSMEVTYSAVIMQSTGEDWNNVALRLSTASTPTGKGAPPLPPTRNARFAPRYQLQQHHQLNSMTNMMMPQQAMQSRMPVRLERRMVHGRRQRATSLSAAEADSDSEDSCDALEIDDQSAPESSGSTAAGSKQTGVSATTFDIERSMTIKADNKEHKCTIAVVTCPATFRLFATPELEELAYIQARAINGGGLTFLSSQRVSVFLAGSFITKTPLKLTSPGESFTVFLGVEAAVKVEHRTVKDVSTEGGKKRGLLRSVTKSTRVVEYRTLLNNSLARPIDITVVHLLPRASSDKIVVNLLAPPRDEVPITGEKSSKAPKAAAATPKSGGGGGGGGGGAKESGEANDNSAGEGAMGNNAVMQNKLTNNVVFTRTLAAQSKSELKFSYEIEWPHDAGTGKVQVV